MSDKWRPRMAMHYWRRRSLKFVITFSNFAAEIDAISHQLIIESRKSANVRGLFT
jgi:hypothetical protein